MVDDDAQPTTRRRRIFGPKRSAPNGRATSVTPAEGPPPAAEPPAAEPPVAELPAAPAGEPPAADQPLVPAAEQFAVPRAAQQGSEPEPAAAPPLGRRPLPSLLFQAPDLPPVLPRREPSPQPDPVEEPAVRRRVRRRPGQETRTPETRSQESSTGEPGTAVLRVRHPRSEEITEPQRIKGSTRLEAKKQRRRDGRDAGRRRAVVTEAEFLARRESVERVMVVRSEGARIEIAVLEDGVLAEHYVAKSQNPSLIGNVYLGRVQNVLPSMEAAFVDIGRGRNAVLYSGEVDWEAAAAESDSKNQPRRIELALKGGDRVLVQVTKDPVGHKGARLTSQVSLPGRYLVYVPNGSMNGISRKLPDTERARLKAILKQVLPDNVGVIIRTAAEGATQEQLTLDVNRLTAQWAAISAAVDSAQAPALLHSEPDLLIKIIRDVFNEDFSRLVIQGADAQETIEGYLRSVAPDLLDRVEAFAGSGDAFREYRVAEQIEKALDRKVYLPSGGSLVIDHTEAMTVIDVNTGKFVGSGGNLEETVTKNNLEAAEEIVRQLRLRDIGGIIVIDFIDMVLENNRDLVLRRLVECLSRDRTKHQVAEVTSLGLVQMTRKKLGLGLLESISDGPERSEPRQQPDSRRRTKPAVPARSNGAAHGGAHAITDDAKNALAQIAASTIHAARSGPSAGTGTGSASGTGSGTAADAAPAPPAADSPADPPLPTAILDIPVTVAPARPRTVAADAEILLGSVLQALPEPKQPGQGRARNRRVSTPALTPTTESPQPISGS